MGQYVDLLRSLPRVRRDVRARAAARDRDVVHVAKQYGADYFDGDRKYGYGGYRYDGRWQQVARDIVHNYGLDKQGGYETVSYKKYGAAPSILDIGCAKGFLVYDLLQDGFCHPYGLDISYYAVVRRPHPAVVGRLHLGTADILPFPDQSFDLVLSINTLHNLPRQRIIWALQEMRRVSRGHMFVQVDSYRTPEEKALFEDWVLTAEWHGYPDEWLALFAEAGYDGDYCWTIVEA